MVKEQMTMTHRLARRTDDRWIAQILIYLALWMLLPKD
jgi:hypothetical protein